MDEFSASFHTQLTEPMRKELGSVLADQDEVVKMALRELLSDIEAMEGDSRLEQQQWKMEKEKLKLEIEAACEEEQIKCQAAVEGMAARNKNENMEGLKEREQMEAEHKSLIAKMKRDEEERETSSKKVTEALMKEVENLVASRDQQLKTKEHYEEATSDMDLRLREKHERILSVEEERDQFKASVLKDSERWHRKTKEVEYLVLSGAVTTVVIKQRLMAELRTQAETWMFGNASESSTDGHMMSGNVPNVFLKWRIRNEWRKLQGNQAFLNDDLQNFCLSKEIETLILSTNAAQDKINQKYKKKIDKIRNEAKGKEAKLVLAELKETSKLEKKKREKMEKIQQAELKEEKKRQLKEKKQREQTQIKEVKEQEKAEAKEQREAKRAKTESRCQDLSHTGRRRFFRACF